jgi:hypothetical protein
MATGDVTISVTVVGGTTKSVTLDSATRIKAKLYATSGEVIFSDDAAWQVYVVNKCGALFIREANNQLETETSITPKTFTPAT